MQKHIVSWSGGKDSTAMLLRMIELDYKIDEIIFVDIRFNNEIGGELPEMYEYIDQVEKYIQRPITRIKSEYTFKDYFYKEYEKGKRKGSIYGFPHTLGGWCNSRLKIKPINKYKREVGDCLMYVGIAADEPKRLARMQKNEVSPLAEWGWTEQDCLQYLKEKGLENPLYKKFKRTGCWFCPKQNKKSLEIVYRDYPKLWQMLLDMEKDSPVTFKPNTTLKELTEEFESKNKQISFLEGEINR